MEWGRGVMAQPLSALDLPIVIAKRADCHTLRCFKRMRVPLRPAENILEFASTKVGCAPASPALQQPPPPHAAAAAAMSGPHMVAGRLCAIWWTLLG